MGEFQKRIRENALEETPIGMASGAKGEDLDYVRICDLLTILSDVKKELKLPVPYSHRSHRHKGRMIETTTFLDSEINEFKENLEKWFSDSK